MVLGRYESMVEYLVVAINYLERGPRFTNDL